MKTTKTLIPILLLFLFALNACKNSTDKKTDQEVNVIQPQGVITVDGIDLNYKAEGSGTPILVLNGSLFSPLFSDKIREKCQLIFIDTRCFIPIETPANLDSWTIGTYVDDIETIRKKLGIEKIAVLGHSAFGFLPLEYAAKYPNSISHAIVIGTPPFIYTNKYAEQAEKYWQTQASEERKSAFQRSLDELEDKNNAGLGRTPTQIWLDNYLSLTPKFWYDFNYDASWIFTDVTSINMDVVNNYYGKLMNNYDPSSHYSKIQCPVFIVNGKYDFWVTPILWESVESKFTNLSNNNFEKSGHFPMFEEQGLFDEKFLKWINSASKYK